MDQVSIARALAGRIRRHVLEMTSRARSAHVGGAFSVADILAVLYTSTLRVDPRQPHWEQRDRLIYSKGHACAALYAALAESGFFPAQQLDTFCTDGSVLIGHASHAVPGVEYSTGSLGHGLPVSCGMALAAKRSGADYRVFVVMSDGECNEGTTWEGALFAAHHHLDNLVVVVDYNKIQSLGRTDEVLTLAPFAEKWAAFGWTAVEIDGHDHAALTAAFNGPRPPAKPAVIVAHTLKGKGVSFMEDRLLWHYRSAAGDEYARAVAELADQ